MSTVKIKLLETDSKLIEAISTCLYDEGGNWYYMPFWFRKVAENVYEQYGFDDLPFELRARISSERQSLKEHLFPDIEKKI